MNLLIAGEEFNSADKSVVLSRTTGDQIYVKREVFVYQGRILGTEKTGRIAYREGYHRSESVKDTETAAFAHINEAKRWVSKLRKQLDVERAQVRLARDEAC